MSLRLALVIHSLDGGGAERLMSQLASRWAEAGHSVHLITLAAVDTDRYPLDRRVERHGLDLMRPSRGVIDGLVSNIKRVQQLRRALLAIEPDFVLSFCDRMNIVTATAARPLGVPVWLAEHSDPRKQRLGWMWETWRSRAYCGASGCVVLTESIAAWMRQRFRHLRIEVIPPAIAPPEHQSSTSRTSASNEKLLLAIGRHSPEKNMQAVLRAWPGLAVEFPDWRLIMAGDGTEHAKLIKLADELGLGARVDFPGWVRDPWSTMAACEAMVLPSLYEGFPVTLLEAMSLGTACVSTPSCDTVQVFAAAGAIQLARSTASEDIAAALREVMGSAERRAQLGNAARRVVEPYTWSQIGPRWNALLPSARTSKPLK